MAGVIFETKPHWGAKLFAVIYFSFWIFMFFVRPDILLEMWYESNIVAKIVELIAIFHSPIFLLLAFVKRTTFTSEYIESRSLFFKKYKRLYNNIDSILVDNHCLTITFFDSKKVVIHYDEGNLDKIYSVLKTYNPQGNYFDLSSYSFYISNKKNVHKLKANKNPNK